MVKMLCFSLSIKDLWGAKRIHLFIYSSTKKFFFIFFLFAILCCEKNLFEKKNLLTLNFARFIFSFYHPTSSFSFFLVCLFFICARFCSKHLTQNHKTLDHCNHATQLFSNDLWKKRDSYTHFAIFRWILWKS